jgi:hypothetical protein
MTQYKFTVGSSPQSVVGNLAWRPVTIDSVNLTYDAFDKMVEHSVLSCGPG